MFNTDNNHIYLTQGNSAIINITPIYSDTGEPAILEGDDKIIFTVKNGMNTTKLQKTLTINDADDDGGFNMIIEPEDTLEWGIGTYYYDCLLILSTGETTTFISSTMTLTKALGKVSDVG